MREGFSQSTGFAALQDYLGARSAFAECVQLCPDFSKAWVSWAQMEKRTRLEALGDHMHRCMGAMLLPHA